jgi:hypothetical protein
MAHIKLTLHEIYKLDTELNGFVDQATGETISLGLLSEDLHLPTKYWLNDLAKKTSSEKSIIDQFKEDLVIKHGSQDENGNISLNMWINEKKDESGNIINPAELNPLFIQFQEEFNTLLQEVKEIEHHEFKLNEFNDVKNRDNYTVFYKLIQID